MHTPAPWTATAKDTINGIPAYWWIQCSAGGVIGDVQSVNPADAALISAAPDLLAALQALLPHVPVPRVPMGQDHADPFPLPDYVKAARAAIAKATGETA